jgi:hypothetical protein
MAQPVAAAEATGDAEARLRACEALRGIVAWLRAGMAG